MDVTEMMDKTISEIAEKQEDPEGTFRKDGILYCSECGEPLEAVKRNSSGEELRIRIRCKCPSGTYVTERDTEGWLERLKAEQAEQDKRYEEERRKNIEKRKRAAFDDIRLKEWTFENDDMTNPRVSSIARNYADNFFTMLDRGKGLLFYGGVGTGKSYIAACIANEVIEQGRSCKFTNFSRLANTLVACEFGEKQDKIDSLARMQLLVIDDLGSERNTEFMNEIVYSIIDARHKSGLPLIVTTNLTGEQLKHPADIHSERVFSRLFEMCFPVEVKGEDRRKLKLRDSDKDLKELLGI